MEEKTFKLIDNIKDMIEHKIPIRFGSLKNTLNKITNKSDCYDRFAAFNDGIKGG